VRFGDSTEVVATKLGGKTTDHPHRRYAATIWSILYVQELRAVLSFFSRKLLKTLNTCIPVKSQRNSLEYAYRAFDCICAIFLGCCVLFWRPLKQLINVFADCPRLRPVVQVRVALLTERDEV